MKKIVKIATLALLMPAMATFVSCDDVFEPAIENHKSEESITNFPLWVNGLLSQAYGNNPLGGWSFSEVATDDAVSNDRGNAYRSMANGSWSASNNPTDQWQRLRSAIQYLNMVIEKAPLTNFADPDQPTSQAMFVDRIQGEAYGLRAFYMLHLLKNHAGWVGNELLGVPIVLESQNAGSEFNVPRNTFKECYEQLIADADSAIYKLPSECNDLKEVPAKYAAMGVQIGEYNRVFGSHMRNRMSGKVAKVVKAQAALLAASPAFASGSGVTMDDAANLFADVLAELGSNPIAEMDPEGHIWYADNAKLSAIGSGENPKEIIWRTNKGENADIEKNNYPPGPNFNGSGRVNPTQNLVDAFPMANGYPITEVANSGYDASKPYEGRDPRLAHYVVYNGAAVGSAGVSVDTSIDNPENVAGLNQHPNDLATRTGYYLRKHLNEQVSINNNGQANNAFHYNAMMRYTEMFLSFAEAANEAWGPTDSRKGYSAYDVIKAIRARAGVGADNGDAYLESIKGDQAKMRELIRNERRIELCFEGFRFWDLRRWKENLTQPARGVRISGGSYSYFDVEQRNFADYQCYGPIPYSEVVKFSNLVQNDGWK